MRQIPTFVPTVDASASFNSQPLNLGDNSAYYIQVIFSNIELEETGVSYTSAGVGPYTVTVTVASTANLTTGQSITVSNASDADADGTKTITVVNPTTFTYTTVADPGNGTLDFTYEAKTVDGTLALEASIDTSYPPTNWISISGSSQAVTNGTNHAWNVSEARYTYVRMVWTYSAGEGQISASAVIPEVIVQRGA